MSINNRVNKLWFVQTADYYTVIGVNELQLHTTWMNVTGTMLE